MFLVSFTSRNLIISLAHLTLFLLPLVPLAGCANDGPEGPMTSSLSTATDATAGLDSDNAPPSSAAEADGEADPKIAMISTSTGVTAHLAWDPPDDFNVTGYNIYYGKRSPERSSSEESGSEEPEPSTCSSGESKAVEDPRATITGLEPNTEYYFSIRAFNDTDSLCSNEISAVTPPMES